MQISQQLGFFFPDTININVFKNLENMKLFHKFSFLPKLKLKNQASVASYSLGGGHAGTKLGMIRLSSGSYTGKANGPHPWEEMPEAFNIECTLLRSRTKWKCISLSLRQKFATGLSSEYPQHCDYDSIRENTLSPR